MGLIENRLVLENEKPIRIQAKSILKPTSSFFLSRELKGGKSSVVKKRITSRGAKSLGANTCENTKELKKNTKNILKKYLKHKKILKTIERIREVNENKLKMSSKQAQNKLKTSSKQAQNKPKASSKQAQGACVAKNRKKTK